LRENPQFLLPFRCAYCYVERELSQGSLAARSGVDF
jgi:hypothetical protein